MNSIDSSRQLVVIAVAIISLVSAPALAQETEAASNTPPSEESAEPAEPTESAEMSEGSADDSSSGSTVQVTDEQRALNDEGVQLMLAGEPARAAAKLEEALELGELNITYLNLGRAYQKAGNCVEARENLLSVFSAPAAPQPAPDVIDEKARQYIRELKQNCVFPEEQRQRKRKMGWWMTGGGAVLTVAGASLFFFGAVQPRNELRNASTDSFGVYQDLSQPEAFEKRDRADLFAVTGISTMSVGIVGLGLGTYYLLANEPTDSKPTATISPDGSFRVGWTWRF